MENNRKDLGSYSPTEVADFLEVVKGYLTEYPLNRNESLRDRADVWQALIPLAEAIQDGHLPEKDRYHRYTSDSTIYNYFLKKGLRPHQANEMVVWVRRYYPTWSVISKAALDKAQQAYRQADHQTLQEIDLLGQLQKAFDWYERDVERSSREAALPLLERNLSRIVENETEASLIRSLFDQKMEAIRNDESTEAIDRQIEELHRLYARLDRRRFRD